MSGLWNRISSAFERTDIGPAGYNESHNVEERVRPTTTRYAPIRNAVERRVNAFLRDDLVSHLEIGDNEIFLLHYIEIAADSQGEAELGQFLHEFSPESRVHWVKKLLGGAVGQHVSVGQFLGLDREFTAEALAETDPFEEALNQSIIPPYRVILHGRWETKSAEDPRSQPEKPPQPARIAGPGLRLAVHDASGSHSADVEAFPAGLGSSIYADVEISGYYVSAKHCTLHWEDGLLWLVDHSTNGTWVDGVHARRGERIALANGAALGFGRDKGGADYERYPSLRVQFMRTGTGADPTPVAPSRGTPVAPAAVVAANLAGARKAPLAVLAIVDATGSPRRDVLELPFTIGRGSAQHYVVPDANQGVSREHLVIEAIDASGALTLNRAVARNGTSAGNEALPERFVWRFGQEIVLGEKWASAPVVRLSLQPTAHSLDSQA